MTKIFRSALRFTIIAVLLLWCSTSLASSLTYTFLTVPSSGNIQGLAGSTIGWGYSITNQDSTDWLVTTNLTSDAFADGIPDASPFDFPVVSPLTTVTLPYDPVADTGLFALTWDANAPIGFTNTGDFTLSAEWWTGDPSVGGSFIQAATDETAAYSVTVSSRTPEPSSFLLLITAMVLVAWWKVHRGIVGRRPAG